MGCTNQAFQPSHTLQPLPTEFQAIKHDVAITVTASASPRTVHGWYFHAAKPEALLIYFHGNGQNRSAHYAYTTAWLKQGFDVLIVDYSGYGESTTPSRFDLAIADVNATLHFAQTHYALPKIAMGASLGGALLINVLANEQFDLRLAIIDSTYASLPELMAYKLKQHWLTWPIAFMPYLLLSAAYDPISVVQKVQVPMLYLACSQDTVITPNASWQLFDATRSKRWFWLMQGCGHIESTLHPPFFDDVVQLAKSPQQHWAKKYDAMRLYSAPSPEF